MNEHEQHAVMHMNVLWWQVRHHLGGHLFHKVLEDAKRFLHMAEHAHNGRVKASETREYTCWAESGPKLHVERFTALDAAVWYAEQHPDRYQVERVIWVEDSEGRIWSFSVRSELAYSYHCQGLSAPDGL